jgi:hypothetical protein
VSKRQRDVDVDGGLATEEGSSVADTPSTDDAAQRLNERLRAHAPRFATALAARAEALGLRVTRPDGGAIAIPVTATVVVISDERMGQRQRTAALLSSATVKMARAAITDDARRTAVLGGLSPLEQSLALATFQQLSTLATTRVDFIGEGDALRALEVNATIPAMQGYSDIAARAFFDVVGAHVGAPSSTIADWLHRNGDNARALHDGLLQGFQALRPGPPPRRIAILCRRHDAQLTELVFLRDRLREQGQATDIVYPDEIVDDDRAGVIGVVGSDLSYDLVYRHLFVRRLEEAGLVGADVVTRLLAAPNGSRAVILNPPASQVEVKAVFALLSEATGDPALADAAGLDDDELQAIAASVPWTRLFRGHDVVARVANDPGRFVLKRAWDYGGRAVFVGHDVGSDAFDARVQAAWPQATSTRDRSWAAVCALAANDIRGGGFVVQEAVSVSPRPHVLCASAGAVDVDLYVDFSAYASVGVAVQPAWGGVCRGSVSSVVNIMGGGGVVPLLRAGVAEEVSAALARVA